MIFRELLRFCRKISFFQKGKRESNTNTIDVLLPTTTTILVNMMIRIGAYKRKEYFSDAEHQPVITYAHEQNPYTCIMLMIPSYVCVLEEEGVRNQRSLK